MEEVAAFFLQQAGLRVVRFVRTAETRGEGIRLSGCQMDELLPPGPEANQLPRRGKKRSISLTGGDKLKKVFWVGLILILISFPLSACTSRTGESASQSPGGTITISGAFALYPMMQIWAEKYQSTHPEITFDISAGGAGKGLADALGGAVDIGMVSRAITPAEEGMGAYWVAVSRDAVFPIVNEKNPVLSVLQKSGVKRDTFVGIYITGTIKTWGGAVERSEITDEIHVYTRSDSAGAADAWAQFLGGKKQDNLMGIGVSGDPGIVGAVASDPLGIGFTNLNFAFDAATGLPVKGINLVPIDNNENGSADSDELLGTKAQAVDAVASGRYPSPPARFENLVTNGKPTGLVQAFILWILTDGQKFCLDAGEVPLTSDQQAASVQKIH